MTMPWDAAMPAETMQPDSPIPAAAPELPAVAINTATGQAIGVDLAPQLRASIQAALDAAVTAHPILGTAVRTAVRDRERADRTIMQSSLFDVAVAILAALFTLVAPDSPVTGVLWLAAAVLASRTMIQGAVYRLRPEAAP